MRLGTTLAILAPVPTVGREQRREHLVVGPLGRFRFERQFEARFDQPPARAQIAESPSGRPAFRRGPGVDPVVDQ